MGDEDLLEIIGNSKNLPRLQKHLKKMFAGVTNIILDDDNNQVLGIGSKEGEEVSVYLHDWSCTVAEWLECWGLRWEDQYLNPRCLSSLSCLNEYLAIDSG